MSFLSCRRLLCTLLTGAFIFCICGCASSEVRAYNAKLHIELSGFDEVLDGMSDLEKSFVALKLDIKSAEYDTSPYSVKLSEANDFSEEIYLTPGAYRISSVSFSSAYKYPYEYEDLGSKVIEIKAENTENLKIKINRIPGTTPLDEIKKAEKYAEKIQIYDTIYDIRNLDQNFTFDTEKKDKNGIPCNEVEGLWAITDNAGKIKGVKFESNKCFIFGGIGTGMDISDIADKDTGIIGMPSKGKGCPVVFDMLFRTRCLFINTANSASVEVALNRGFTTVESVKYMLGKDT